MKVQKAYVTRDNTAVLKCPHCGISKTAPVGRFKDRKDPLKVRCTCRSAFYVSFDFRQTHRKGTYLEGYYGKLPACKEWGKMVVKNVSAGGIGFSTFAAHNLAESDAIRLKFTLDDKKRSDIERDAIVRGVKERYLGCEFTDPAQFDKTLGFYLMP